MLENELNGYQKHFYKSNGCKKALIQQISKVNKGSKVKCSTESLSDPAKVINFINGHQIRDLHRIAKNNKTRKADDVKASNIIVPSNEKIMRKLTKGKEQISCKCPNGFKRVNKTAQINGGCLNQSCKRQTHLSPIKNERSKPRVEKNNHRKKNINDPEDDKPKEYVLRSSQRLQYIHNMKKRDIEIDKPLVDRMTNMFNEPIDIRLDTKKLNIPVLNNNPQSRVNCEWGDCRLSFINAEDLTDHVESSHLVSCEESDNCSCMWRDCKFLNQSCSFKWLSKHVLRHCDLKPFKCVILGCDMTFSTQNGLARHVPTHFNESRVRRACVLTHEAARKEELNKTKRQLSATLSTCSESSSGTFCSSGSSSLGEEIIFDNASIPNVSVGKHTDFRENHHTFTTKTYNYVKKKIQKSTFDPSTNSGYLDKAFRIDHKVIGRRSGSNGITEMLLTPSLNNLFPRSSFWCDSNEFRKRKHSHVEIPMRDMPVDIKNKLYDSEHASSIRRRKKRK
ncbi:uncharacterized protein [Clytia hemisphaerica]|uniref:C2H2-type domain-containing protein n=1 Tax=Clytia hemisphaerica TaxID=252671 RepID=A0A7M5WU47_9CNID